MAAQVPYTSNCSLSYPDDAGLAATTKTNAVAGNFTSKVDITLVLSGAGTQVVDLGTIPVAGAKEVQIEVDADSSPSAAPVNVQFNGVGAPGNIEISPGGGLKVSNPNPASGITALSIVFTASACVHVRILG